MWNSLPLAVLSNGGSGQQKRITSSRDIAWPFVLVHVSFEIYILHKHCPPKWVDKARGFLKMGNVLQALVLFLPLRQTWIKSLHLNQTEGHWKEEETVQTPKASPPCPKHNNTIIYMIWGWSKSHWNDEEQSSESQSLRKLAVRWDILRLFVSLCLLERQKQTWALLQKYFLIEFKKKKWTELLWKERIPKTRHVLEKWLQRVIHHFSPCIPEVHGSVV